MMKQRSTASSVEIILTVGQCVDNICRCAKEIGMTPGQAVDLCFEDRCELTRTIAGTEIAMMVFLLGLKG